MHHSIVNICWEHSIFYGTLWRSWVVRHYSPAHQWIFLSTRAHTVCIAHSVGTYLPMIAAVTAHCNSNCTQPQRTQSAKIVNWHKRPVLLLASSTDSKRQGAQKIFRHHVATNIVYWMALHWLKHCICAAQTIRSDRVSTRFVGTMLLRTLSTGWQCNEHWLKHPTWRLDYIIFMHSVVVHGSAVHVHKDTNEIPQNC